MDVLFDGVGLGLEGGQGAPVGCERAEEAVVVKIVLARGDAQHAFDAGQVGDGLGVQHGAVDLDVLHGLKAAVVVDQLLGALVEAAVVLLGPPVAQVPPLVILAAGGVEGMGDLVGNDDADMAQLLLVGHFVVVEFSAQDACGYVDGVVERVVVGVDLLGIGDPGFAVDGLVDLLRVQAAGLLRDGDAGIDQGAALVGAGEIEKVVKVGILFAEVLLAGDADGEIVQLFNGLRAGPVGQKVGGLEHGVILVQDVIDEFCDVSAGPVGDVGLGVDIAQLGAQDAVDGIAGGLFVLDLAGGAGEDVLDHDLAVVAVVIEQVHELEDIGDQEVGLHLVQMFFVVELAHAGQPLGLLEDKDLGFLEAGALEHAGQGKIALLRDQVGIGAWIVGPDGGILGAVFLGRHHVGGHFALKGIAVLEDLVPLLIEIAQALQHVAGGLHIAGLGLPAVGLQVVVVRGIREDQGRGCDVDGVVVRVVGVGRREGAAEGQGPDGRVGIGQIVGHLVQVMYVE